MGISRDTLDLSNGTAGKGGERFINPISPEIIDSWLNQTKPWHNRPDFVHPHEKKPIYNPQGEADWLWVLTDIWLEDAEDESAYGIMPTRTKWKRVSNGDPHLNRLCEPNANWQVPCLLRRVTEPTRDTIYQPPYDTSKPHSMGFLADDALLRADMLSTSEVFTVLYRSVKLLVNPAFKQHSRAPVTILSASNRSVRVIQGFVDPWKGIMEVRSSPILHFPTGVMDNYGEYLVLLGWLLGEPVGKTI